MQFTLKDYSEQELEAELKERKALKTQAPTPLEQPTWGDLLETIQSCVDQAVKMQYWDEDSAHYIFESAMMAVYGEDFFRNWYNKQKWVTG